MSPSISGMSKEAKLPNSQLSLAECPCTRHRRLLVRIVECGRLSSGSELRRSCDLLEQSEIAPAD
jgi:hypothetical protein